MTIAQKLALKTVRQMFFFIEPDFFDGLEKAMDFYDVEGGEQMETTEVKKKIRGFNSPSFNKDLQRKISSLGGKAAWTKGTAHKWTSAEARKAGTIGGRAKKRKV